VGGQNRTCAQPELSSSWAGSVSALGWRLIPIFKGRQAGMPAGVTGYWLTWSARRGSFQPGRAKWQV
jgi:hypothetical protein